MESKPKRTRSKKLVVAVRDFAMPLKRTGSLGQGSSNAIPLDVGSEIHKRIQSRLLSEEQGYKSEVSLSTVLSGKKYELKLRGRCDGIFDSPDAVAIEEIKSTFNLQGLLKSLALEVEHPYLLQLKIYGYIYHLRSARIPKLQLRLVDSRTLKEEIVPVEFNLESFDIWMNDKLGLIEQELERYRLIVRTRKQLASRLFFPFPKPRSQQAELVDLVEKSLLGKKKLLLQAPTGLGKTAGVLYPSLKVALGQGSPVVYVAPKNSQFQAAIDLAKMFQKAKVKIKVLVLTSKAKACKVDEVLCQNSTCPMAIDYFDKVEAQDLSNRDDKRHLWDYRYFLKLSDSFQVCPYELSMERIPEADLVICDYNYVFSPRANLIDRYLNPIIPLKKPFLVIDESHNLYERVIENYSPEIKLSELRNFLDNCRTEGDDRFARIVQRAIGLMSVIKPLPAQAKVEVKRESIGLILEESLALILSRWGEGGLPALNDPLFRFYQQWLNLEEISALSQDAIPLVYLRENGDETLRAQCIDPYLILEPLYSQFAGVIAFSATLKPFEFYRHMSGFHPQSSEAVEFTSPFPRENKKIMIIPQVETSFRERDRHYERIALIIERTVAEESGPYLVFFSSYSFLREVETFLAPRHQILTQSGSLSENGIRSLAKTIREGEDTKLILAVQGGSLSEGVDFKGLGLKGVFVVGPAVPNTSFARKLMQEHFEKILDTKNGRAFAYVYPAMTRSVQAAGRVIRDETERGLIVLMDPRFLGSDYASAMPEDWFKDDPSELVPKRILPEVRDFWGEHPPKSDLRGSETTKEANI